MAQTSRSNPAIGGAVPTQWDPEPSRDDIKLSKDLAEVGELLGIELLDHVVIGSDGWVSLKTEGLF
ncbi:MAG: hypothetical protein OXH48_02150 [Chloroflexi bacterium]|nr:hypothetical protein [Chloroflexota bacterium]MCY3588061.1 hypothetical protein [Chloroflexota bacterium]MCY3686944.1 hypothetical protein [Chloroflexota bacterium]MDE2709029.1 hypothetical protein [Chloroflexota bacterium]